MKNLVFSFIIPAHNEEEVIADCLDSIKNQKVKKNYEIIVVNDGSSDKTKEIIENLMKTNKKIKLINNKNGTSAAYARNRGSEKAEGKYLIFLDSDQTLEKDFMKKLNKLAEEKDFDSAAIRILSTKPETIFQRGWHAYRKYNKCAAMIIRKKIFDKIKFREDLFYVEDDVLFEEVKKKGCELEESGVLVYHIDPKTFKDYLRQRKWQGRGLAMKIFRLKKYWAVRHFVPCLILPLMFISVYLLPIYLFLFWIFFSIKSGEPFNSFWWTITDFFGRYISLFWFLVYSVAALIKGKII